MAYIPSKDADLINWGRNYTDLLTADPARYGLQAADALTLHNLFDDFDAAYALAIDPNTRTKVNVALKDGHKADFLSLARAYAAIIRANRGVTDEDKTALGLNIPDPTPTPVPVPTTVPVMSIPLVGQNVHMFTIVDQLTPSKKAKPEGVAGLLLHRKVGATPATVFEDFTVCGLLTRSDELVSTLGVASGQYVTYAGQWYNRKGELGPLSALVGSRVL